MSQELSPDEAIKVKAFGLDRPEHEIVWEFEDDSVTQHLVCNDTECQYRWSCDDGCELLFDVEKTDTGYRHPVVTLSAGIENPDAWHELVKGSCNFVEWMQADPSMIPELNESRETFEIGRTAVNPVWAGEDGCTWLRPEMDRSVA